MVALTTAFQSSLVPCSWQGITFFVLAAETRAGQRAYTHSYPFNDQVYTEPLGRAARQYIITGYLVGDDLNAQYSAMLAQIESKAPGQLVHPSLGNFQVVCVNAECTQTTAGRLVEIKFTFVEAGSPIYPTSGVDTAQQTISTTQQGQAAADTSFGQSVEGAGNGQETVNGNFQENGDTSIPGGGGSGGTTPLLTQTGDTAIPGGGGNGTLDFGQNGDTAIPSAAITATNATSEAANLQAVPSTTFSDLTIGGELVPGPIFVPPNLVGQQ